MLRFLKLINYLKRSYKIINYSKEESKKNKYKVIQMIQALKKATKGY